MYAAGSANNPESNDIVYGDVAHYCTFW